MVEFDQGKIRGSIHDYYGILHISLKLFCMLFHDFYANGKALHDIELVYLTQGLLHTSLTRRVRCYYHRHPSGRMTSTG